MVCAPPGARYRISSRPAERACRKHHFIFERSVYSQRALRCPATALSFRHRSDIHVRRFHLGRRVLLKSESAPFQLLRPTKWIRAVSWPTHALTLACVFEEGRGAQGDTAGIETGETVRGSTTGKQQLLAVLLLLRKHRGGGGSGGPARLLRASRHDFGCLEVSGGPARLMRACRHEFGCL